LHPSLSEATKVPWIGNIMTSRWAYEALAVEQASQNNLEKQFLSYEIKKSKADWKKNYWIPELRNQVNILKDNDYDYELQETARRILINEIKREDASWKGLDCQSCIENLNGHNIDVSQLKPITLFLNQVRAQYISSAKKYSDSIRKKKYELGIENYKVLRNNYENDALNKLVSNKLETNKFIISDDRILQNDSPIYNLPNKKEFFSAHFYAPYKFVFGKKVATYTINVTIIWGMILIGYIILYFDLLKKVIDKIQSLVKK